MQILRHFQCSFYAVLNVGFTPFSLHVLRLASLAQRSLNHRNTRLPGFWDTVSVCEPVGKVRPILRSRNGTQLPLQTKAPARKGTGAKGAAYAIDGERERPFSSGRPRSTLPAVTGAAVRGIHHGQIRTQLAVKRAVGILHGGRRGNRGDLADALAAVCHGQ